MKKGNAVLELIVVLALVIFALWSMKNSSTTVVVSDTPGIVSTEDTSTGSVNVVAPKILSYEQALVRFKDSRIQLDKNCQAYPNVVTYKNNTDIMIDNRSPLARTIKIGSVYNVKAYGFKIIRLSSLTLPVTFLMDCGTSENVATILIQK